MRGLIVHLIIHQALVAHCRASPRDPSSQKLRGSQQRHTLHAQGSDSRLELLHQSDQAALLKLASVKNIRQSAAQLQFEANASEGLKFRNATDFFLEDLVHPTLEWSKRVIQGDWNFLRPFDFDVEYSESITGANNSKHASKLVVKPVFFICTVSPFGLGWTSLLIWAILVLLFGCIYHEQKQAIKPYLMMDPEQYEWAYQSRKGDSDEWAVGLLQVYEEPKLCLFTCCCGAVRWAETISMSGLMSFFSALMLFVVLTFIGSFSYSWIIFVGVLTYFRQRLRIEYDLPFGDPLTIAEDCCTYCWCSPCALTQEAIHVELATKKEAGFFSWFG